MWISRSIALLGLVAIPLAVAQKPELAPKVVLAWAAGPMEARVAFDRPVDPEVATRVVGESIRFGEGEKPGEAGRPGGDQGALRIASAKLVDDGRTLVLFTDPHPRETPYRLTLPVLKSPGDASARGGAEVEYLLGGVEVSWSGKGQLQPSWSGWWPVFDSDLARELTKGSFDQGRLWPSTNQPGRLTLRTMLVLPVGKTQVGLESASPFEATLGNEVKKSAPSKTATFQAVWNVEATGETIDLAATIATGLDATRIRLVSGTGDLPRSAFVLPWAPPPIVPTPVSPVPAEFLTGGDPIKGETVFLSEQAKCSTCHRVRDKGGAIGPDLSNLAGRDRTWIYQNIVEPSASIHPDFVTHTVVLKDGRIAMGVVRADGADSLKVGDIEGKQTALPRAEVEEIRPSSTSIMPVGLLAAIGEEQTRDLLAYLTASRPAPSK